MHVTAPWFVSIRPLQPGSGPRRASPSPCPARFPAPSKPRARAHPPPPPPCLVFIPPPPQTIRPVPRLPLLSLRAPTLTPRAPFSFRLPRPRCLSKGPCPSFRGTECPSGGPACPPGASPPDFQATPLTFPASFPIFDIPIPIRNPTAYLGSPPPNRDPASESRPRLRIGMLPPMRDSAPIRTKAPIRDHTSGPGFGPARIFSAGTT